MTASLLEICSKVHTVESGTLKNNEVHLHSYHATDGKCAVMTKISNFLHYLEQFLHNIDMDL